jgi:hypothetical protein
MSNWLIADNQNVALNGTPSAGFFIGTGDQDTYVKLVVGGKTVNSAPTATIQHLYESGGVVQEGVGNSDPTKTLTTNRLLAQANPADNISWIQLRFTVDKSEGSVAPKWRYGTDAERHPTTGALPSEAVKPFAGVSSFAVSGPLLGAIRNNYQVGGEPSGLAVGIIGTSVNGTPFTVDYDDLVISASPVGFTFVDAPLPASQVPVQSAAEQLSIYQEATLVVPGMPEATYFADHVGSL